MLNSGRYVCVARAQEGIDSKGNAIDIYIYIYNTLLNIPCIVNIEIMLLYMLDMSFHRFLACWKQTSAPSHRHTDFIECKTTVLFLNKSSSVTNRQHLSIFFQFYESPTSTHSATLFKKLFDFAFEHSYGPDW